MSFTQIAKKLPKMLKTSKVYVGSINAQKFKKRIRSSLEFECIQLAIYRMRIERIDHYTETVNQIKRHFIFLEG